MITRHEAERIAASIHAYRPEWPAAQILTLCGDLRDWPLIDLYTGLAYIAADPDSRSPYRVREQGPWRTIGLANPVEAAAKDRATQELAARRATSVACQAAATACHLCDDHGYLSGRVCTHTDDRARAHRGAQLARRNLRPTRGAGQPITDDADTEETA